VSNLFDWRQVRWVTTRAASVTLSTSKHVMTGSHDLVEDHKAMVPSADVKNFAEALIGFYDPAVAKPRTVPVDPAVVQVPAPDLNCRLAKIIVGAPRPTEGFWWTSPNFANDMARARLLTWDEITIWTSEEGLIANDYTEAS